MSRMLNLVLATYDASIVASFLVAAFRAEAGL
jgi:hypothetical protein